ncbi:MAG: hypothetical protein GC138_07595 [Gammaproteobacteria bacterium]|nr:hypothetical protein [Gammaproteobacteria bacterium]
MLGRFVRLSFEGGKRATGNLIEIAASRSGGSICHRKDWYVRHVFVRKKRMDGEYSGNLPISCISDNADHTEWVILMGVPFSMNDFLKKAFSYDFSLGEEQTDMVVNDQAVLFSHVDDWGNEWETTSYDAHQDVDFLKAIANR